MLLTKTGLGCDIDARRQAGIVDDSRHREYGGSTTETVGVHGLRGHAVGNGGGDVGAFVSENFVGAAFNGGSVVAFDEKAEGADGPEDDGLAGGEDSGGGTVAFAWFLHRGVAYAEGEVDFAEASHGGGGFWL
jgi:hypothetical protein